MYTVAAFYKFTPLPNYQTHREPLLALAREEDICGSILLAAEGLNGTIAGRAASMERMLGALRALPGCQDLEHKQSEAEQRPFNRLKVRLKKEIVTMGVDVDAAHDAGTYVDAKDWNRLISDPDVVLIDTRNTYETKIGVFDGAIDPGIQSFGELPDWLDAFARDNPNKKLAMYCTGGIRCEKSTAYAKSLGYQDVFHLKGGILKYLEEVPATDSKWQGECYVFDHRVSVDHELNRGQYVACGACGRPVGPDDRAHASYERGVTCPACINEYTDADRMRFRERQRQIDLGQVLQRT